MFSHTYNSPEEIKDYMSMTTAAISIGWDPEKAFVMIEHYAQRNEIMHKSVDQLLQRKKFHDLARILHEDFEQLNEASVDERIQMEIRKIIEALRIKYFDILPGDEDEPQAWAIKDAARSYSGTESIRSNQRQRIS